MIVNNIILGGLFSNSFERCTAEGSLFFQMENENLSGKLL